MNMAASQGEGQEGSGTLYQVDMTLDMMMDGTYQTTSTQPGDGASRRRFRRGPDGAAWLSHPH